MLGIRDSLFNAQVSMFPAMIHPSTGSGSGADAEFIEAYIEKYEKHVMAYKMPGAGGGGYLACVVEDAEKFCKEHEEAIRLTIRRAGM